jgi:transforming growth factor-beta-induced protein
MYTVWYRLLSIVVAVALFATTSAAALAAEPQDIVDIAVADGRFTTLVAALTAAGLVDTLKGAGPFTVFAPTDDAFKKLPEGTVEGLLKDIPALTKILLYHVVPAHYEAAALAKLTTVETVGGPSLTVKVEQGNVRINDAQVIIADVKASNGVIHVIDTVLLPPAEPAAPDIVDLAVADGRFTTLAKALTEAGLVNFVKQSAALTVFAPTDDAFAKLPEGTLDALLKDKAALTRVLLYHIAPGQAVAQDVVNMSSVATFAGAYPSIRAEDGKVMVDDAQVIIPDLLASNGVIHVIDSVLLPPATPPAAQKDIVEVAVADGRFTTLAAALTAAGLVDALKGPGPFTVFAPTDDAFKKLPEGTVEGLLKDIPALTKILLYHVAPGKVIAGDVIKLKTLGTLADVPVSFKVSEGKVMVGEAQVILTDIVASNGVIHVIDTVLLPPQ